MLAPWKKSYDKPRQSTKNRDIRHYTDEGPSSQSDLNYHGTWV